MVVIVQRRDRSERHRLMDLFSAEGVGVGVGEVEVEEARAGPRLEC